jgi:hypothetical protein
MDAEPTNTEGWLYRQSKASFINQIQILTKQMILFANVKNSRANLSYVGGRGKKVIVQTQSG